MGNWTVKGSVIPLRLSLCLSWRKLSTNQHDI